MKAVVLCAGVGTRLEPLTFARPKHLLPVAGRAVLDHVLEALVQAGIREAVFVVGRQRDRLEEFVGDGSRWELENVKYEVQESPRGLADAVRCARPAVESEDPFIVYLGDDLVGDGVADFVADFKADFKTSKAQGSVMAKRVEDPRQFGVVVCEGGRVLWAKEKPPHPPPNGLAIVGVYGFGRQIFDAIESIEPSDRGELEITDAIDLLAHEGRVRCYEIEGFWADVGSPESLLRANAFYLGRIERRIEGAVCGQSRIEDLVQIGAGATVTNSTIRGPCLIGADCVVTDSELGPDVSLGDDCRVVQSRVVNSILDEGCQVEGVQGGLAGSLLGPGVRLQGARGVQAQAPLHVLAAYGAVTAETDSG